MAELGSSDQDCVALKNWSLYSLALHIKFAYSCLWENKNNNEKQEKIDKLEKPISNPEPEHCEETLR